MILYGLTGMLQYNFRGYSVGYWMAGDLTAIAMLFRITYPKDAPKAVKLRRMLIVLCILAMM